MSTTTPPEGAPRHNPPSQAAPASGAGASGPLPSTDIRLLLVDVHAISRRSSRLLLDSLPGLVVVGETSEHQEALRLVSDLRPDVVLISMRVQGANGPETARQILQRVPTTRVVFLTLFDDPEYVDSALEAGALGYVLKQEPAAEILKAILKVAHGQTYLSPGLSARS
jgi:DNA-binding NarL/FixJ family response regulator